MSTKGSLEKGTFFVYIDYAIYTHSFGNKLFVSLTHFLYNIDRGPGPVVQVVSILVLTPKDASASLAGSTSKQFSFLRVVLFSCVHVYKCYCVKALGGGKL